jgi:hypothetical protein
MNQPTDRHADSTDRDPGISLEAIPDEPLTRGTWTTIPLVHDRIVYGVLVLFADRSDPFDEREVAVLDELGETIGYAINAAESKQTLLTDAIVELELLCTDPAAALVTLSSRAECEIDLEGVVPATEGTLLAYQSVEGTTPEEVQQLGGEAAGVTAIRCIDDRDEGGLFEFTLGDGSLLASLTEHGTNIRSMRTENGECRAVVEATPEMDIRSLVAHLQRSFPEIKVLSKRELDRPIERIEALSDGAFDDLTDRQREAIEAAYRAGYFDWPRESTAEEVADSMAISSPTLHRHLRKAQNDLLSEFFDEQH